MKAFLIHRLENFAGPNVEGVISHISKPQQRFLGNPENKTEPTHRGKCEDTQQAGNVRWSDGSYYERVGSVVNRSLEFIFKVVDRIFREVLHICPSLDMRSHVGTVGQTLQLFSWQDCQLHPRGHVFACLLQTILSVGQKRILCLT